MKILLPLILIIQTTALSFFGWQYWQNQQKPISNEQFAGIENCISLLNETIANSPTNHIIYDHQELDITIATSLISAITDINKNLSKISLNLCLLSQSIIIPDYLTVDINRIHPIPIKIEQQIGTPDGSITEPINIRINQN